MADESKTVPQMTWELLISHGGAAFPFDVVSDDGLRTAFSGMSMRDWFATHCPDSWLKRALPNTAGEIRAALVQRGIISGATSTIGAWNDGHMLQLAVMLRWEYADAMIAARRGAAS